MTTVIFRTEEIVVRETTVIVPDDIASPAVEAERKFWDGLYDSSRDVDRRDERILSSTVQAQSPVAV